MGKWARRVVLVFGALMLVVAPLWAGSAFAATTSGVIDITGLSPSEYMASVTSGFTGSTVVTVTGTGLPVLTSAGSAMDGGDSYENFAVGTFAGASPDLVGDGESGWGVDVLMDTSTEIQFTIPDVATLGQPQSMEVFLAPSDSTVLSGANLTGALSASGVADYGGATGQDEPYFTASVANGVVSVVTGGPGSFTVDVGGVTKDQSVGGTVTFPGLAAGSYSVGVVSSQSGTLASQSVTVVGLSLSATATASGDATITVQGGTSPYYVTMDGDTKEVESSGGSATFDSLPTGSNTAEVEDSGQRRDSVSVEIAGALSGTTAVSGTSLSVTVQGGVPPYTVTTQGDSRTVSAVGGSTTFTGLAAGASSVTIIDSDANHATLPYTISGPPLSVTAMGGVNQLTIDIAGGVPPYTVSVVGGPTEKVSGSSLVVKNLNPGTYVVDVSDDVGNEVSAEGTVGSIATALTVTVAPQPTSAVVAWQGGSAPFRVVFAGTTIYSGSGNQALLNGLTAGQSYKVSVTSAGDTITQSFVTPKIFSAPNYLPQVMNLDLNLFSRVGHWVGPVIVVAMLLGVLLIGSAFLWRLSVQWLGWSEGQQARGQLLTMKYRAGKINGRTYEREMMFVYKHAELFREGAASFKTEGMPVWYARYPAK